MAYFLLYSCSFLYLLLNPYMTEPLHYLTTISLLPSTSTIAMSVIVGYPHLFSPSPVLGVVLKTPKLNHIRFSNLIVTPFMF
jgi:hypothetical protein